MFLTKQKAFNAQHNWSRIEKCRGNSKQQNMLLMVPNFLENTKRQATAALQSYGVKILVLLHI